MRVTVNFSLKRSKSRADGKCPVSVRCTMNNHLDNFFPQIPNADKITIAHILAHRSGIPDLTVDEGWGSQPRTHEEVIDAIAKGKPIFEPDSQHLSKWHLFNRKGWHGRSEIASNSGERYTPERSRYNHSR